MFFVRLTKSISTFALLPRVRCVVACPVSQELIDLTAPTFVKELDYEIEASNQRRFAQTVEDCELIRDTIVVPEILFANRHLGW